MTPEGNREEKPEELDKEEIKPHFPRDSDAERRKNRVRLQSKLNSRKVDLLLTGGGKFSPRLASPQYYWPTIVPKLCSPFPQTTRSPDNGH